MLIKRTHFGGGLAALLLFTVLDLAGADLSKLPPAATKKVAFATDIKPILEKSCLHCHGAERPKSKYRIDSREAAIKGGSSGETAIVPGNSEKSRVIHFAAQLVEEMEMPPISKKDQPLTRDQISLLRAWIDQGVAWE